MKKWIVTGFCISLVAALGYSTLYSTFRQEAFQTGNVVASDDNITAFYGNNYVLYRDLYNVENGINASYGEIYLNLKDSYNWLLSEAAYEQELAILETPNEAEQAAVLYGTVQHLSEYVESLRVEFGGSNFWDYCITDTVTGKYLTNMSETDLSNAVDNAYFLISFVYDSAGHVTVGDVICQDEESVIRRMANEIVRTNLLEQEITDYSGTLIYKIGDITGPKDCKVTYSLSKGSFQTGSLDPFHLRYAYLNTGAVGCLMIFLLGVFLLAALLPVVRKQESWKGRIFALPLEVQLMAGVAVFTFGCACSVWMVIWTASGMSGWFLNCLYFTLFFFCAWYYGVYARGIAEQGIVPYVREKSLIYRFFPYVRSKAKELYRSLEQMDLTKNAHKKLLKIVLLNAVILFIISSLWFGGFAITVVYSAFLYFVLRKYLSDLQKKYQILLKATNEMAQGNLNVTIPENLGIFEPFKPELLKIQTGFKGAVEEEVKSQKMKAELITNVSHDLKTPLTAIITYVNLLKQENITEEERNSYIQILDQKSMRLKELIEDLFEVSKAANGTVVLHPEEVDVVSLLKQVHFELSDKIEASGIQFHFDLPNERLAASLDGQKTCRIFENLLVNITKYGMKGTRAYIKAEKDGEYVQVTLRNISAEELKISPEELTERFVRGDASRNTEGSGLGLAIARSFTEVQGGTMKIEVEEDLFRVILRWKLKDGSEEPEETIQEGSVQEKLVQEEPEADDLDTSDQ